MIFPALFSSYFGLYAENLEPFELGHQAIFVITSNVIIFSLGILYYKKKIPSTLNNAIEKVRAFELSKRVTLVSLFVIIGIYVIINKGIFILFNNLNIVGEQLSKSKL